MEMLNNAMAYFSPPSTPRKIAMQFFENLNPLNSYKTDASSGSEAMPSQSSDPSNSGSTLDKNLPQSKNPLSPKSAGAAFNFSNNTISPTPTSAYPTTLSPAAIVLDKPPTGRASRPLSMIMGKKKKPPPLPPCCEPSTSLTEIDASEEGSQEIDPEILAGALEKVVLKMDKEVVEESPALFPPRPPKPCHLSRSSSLSVSTSSIPTKLAPPPIPPKTYKKSYGYSS